MKERGLKGVSLLVSDKCLGLLEAWGEFYPEASWQRCMVHWYRNVMSVVPKSKVKEVMAMLKAIHAQEDRQAARDKASLVAEKLDTMRFSQAATIVRGGVDETLSYMTFPREHWIRIRTNNVLERIMREIRRRTRVVGNFPDGKSAVMLVAARLRHIAGTRWGKRVYLDMERLREVKQNEAAITIARLGNFVRPSGNKGTDETKEEKPSFRNCPKSNVRALTDATRQPWFLAWE